MITCGAVVLTVVQNCSSSIQFVVNSQLSVVSCESIKMSSRLLLLSLSASLCVQQEELSATCSADGLECGDTSHLLVVGDQEFEPCSSRGERDGEGQLYRMLIVKAGYILQE